MKINIFLKKGILLIAFTCFMSMLNGQTVSNYEYTGALQTYLVPAGVNSITIEVWGAEGGESDGSGSHGLVPAGQGGYAKGDLSVTPGQTLYIYVGGQGNINITYQSLSAGGWNGGGDGWGGWSGNWNAGNGTSGGGGGASDVRVGGTSLSDRVIVAGGGGGSDSWATARWGGDGGGLTGGTSGGGATGGTQSTGGVANHSNSTDGSFGQGGDGYTSSSQGHGAGGGGGYYGGGGGQHGGAGGSGGSSYIGGVINGSTTSGGRQGNGLIVITAPESMPEWSFMGLADMNYERYGAGYTTDGEYVYALCGAKIGTRHTHGERYNTDTDSWEIFVEDLIPRRYINAEYLNGNIYLFNGNTYTGYTDTVEIIDVSTGAVAYSETNPYPVKYGGSAVWDNKIYLYGGSNNDGYSNRLYEFDPANESWTRLADMPENLETRGRVVDGILYIFGGYNGAYASSKIYAYNIAQDSWNTGLTDMPVPLSSHSTVTNGEMIAIIGDYSNIEFSGSYDPSNDTFLQIDNNMEGRRHSASVYFNGDLYTFGGSQPEGFNGNTEYVVLKSTEKCNLSWSFTGVQITGTSGFRMLSSPVSGTVYGDLLEELYTQGMIGSDNPDVQPNVWTWNNSWNALTDLTTDNYTAGSGVLVYVYADTDFDGTDDLPVNLTIYGTQNTSPVTIATTEDSWNLLGNPYGYSLSIQQLATDNSGYGPVYIWDSASGAYKNHNGTTGDIADGLIAPFQGFFSEAAAGATSYTFTESSISTVTGTNYRTAVESEGSGVIAFTSGDQVSKVFLSFNLTGDFGMDHSDASRLLPLSHNDHLVSMFYVDDEALAINNLPYDFNADLSVDLDVMHLEATDSGFDPVSETVTMTWDLSDIPEGMNIVMMNNETYTIINLHEVDEYTFTLEDKDGFELEENVVGSYPLVGQSQFTMFISSATAGSDEAVLPKTFTLQPAYPNPFNPSTTIRYSIPETGSVLMKIYDLSGREVSTLIDQVMPAGYHSLSWNPQNTAAAGIYIVQVINGKEVLNQKITYLK